MKKLGKEGLKIPETKQKECTTYENLWDALKTVLREKFTHIIAYNKKESCQINNLMMQPDVLEKQEQNNLEISRKKEIIKIHEEINEKETKRSK